MIKPETENELAQAIAGAKGGLRIIGGGTRDIGRPVHGETLTTAGLTGVTLYEPGALTLVAAAGTPVAEIDAILAAQGQRLGFEPMDHRGLLGTQGTPTIGGVIAANVSGPRRLQVGAARDFTLGVRFVDGRGQVLKNGGRVMKNVTGYDLVKLMAGSWGTLGVLSEVALKVMAIPEAEMTLMAPDLDATSAIEKLSRALGSPYDVSGAAHMEIGTQLTMLRLEGLGASVAYRARALRETICAGWQIVEGEASAKMWQDLRDLRGFGVAADTPTGGAAGAVWRMSVKPTDGPVLTQNLAGAGVAFKAIYDWGGGLVWLLVPAGTDASAVCIRAQVTALGGHATLVRASREQRQELAVFEPLSGKIAAITRQIQHKFDPRGILNPGLMGG